MIRFLFCLILYPFTNVASQKELFITNKVKQYTCVRQRFFPDQIPKEIYSIINFDQQGRITEKYEPYNIPQSFRTRFTYNDHGNLIKIERTKKDGTVSEVISFPNDSDSVKSRGWLPAYPRESNANWEKALQNSQKVFRKSDVVTTDTLYDKKNNIKKITISIRKPESITTGVFSFCRKKIKYYKFFSQRDSLQAGGIVERFNKKGGLIERISTGSFVQTRHFKYKYYHNGILKKYTSYSIKGIVNEICWYQVKYY